METTIQIAADVRAMRTVRRKTLAEVAAATGLSPSFLSDIERGRTVPTIATLEKIAAAYGMHLHIAFRY